jgi:Rha family phage regulatory protein
MNNLQLVKQNGQVLADSRDIAEMTGKKHFNLVRDIEGYIYILENSNLSFQDFFIESSYKVDGNNKTYKSFLLTKIGCDMVANKMTGTKGVLFTAAYTKKFEEMEKQLSGQRLPRSYREALQQLLVEVEHKERLETQNLVLTQQVQEFQPKASYYDLVLQTKSLMTATQIAKDYGMGAKTLNRKLHELEVQYKHGGTWLLYSKYQDKGYTATTTHVIDADKSKVNTKWTQKGRLFLYDLLKRHDILPTIEREESLSGIQA